MFHYICITIAPNYTTAHYIISSDKGNDIDINLSYEEGMKVLRQLEKMSGKLASLNVNYYDRHICDKTLYCFE